MCHARGRRPSVCWIRARSHGISSFGIRAARPVSRSTKLLAIGTLLATERRMNRKSKQPASTTPIRRDKTIEVQSGSRFAAKNARKNRHDVLGLDRLECASSSRLAAAASGHLRPTRVLFDRKCGLVHDSYHCRRRCDIGPAIQAEHEGSPGSSRRRGSASLSTRRSRSRVLFRISASGSPSDLDRGSVVRSVVRRHGRCRSSRSSSFHRSYLTYM
jgi:hypothetical protein